MSTQTTAAARERYLKLIEATLRHALTNRRPPATAGPLTMEHALPSIARQLGFNSVKSSTEFGDSLDAPVLDGAGNARQVYRPLLMRAAALHVAASTESTDHAFDAYRTQQRPRVRAFAEDRRPLRAADGAEIVARLFEALAIETITRRSADWSESVVVDAFHRVIEQQADDGTFLARTSADQLEPAWYHELAVLHAMHAYASMTDDDDALEAAARSARYHAEQVQPDHASSHPFGLAALLDDAEGIYLADMMLHAAGVQQPATMDATSLVLLFDALDCERRVKPA